MPKFGKKSLLLLGVPAAGALSFAGFALANTATVSTTSLGSGSSAVNNSCNLSESYTSAYKAPNAVSTGSAAGYYVTAVTTTPSDATACGSKSYRVTLSDGSSVSLAEVNNQFVASAVAITDTLTTPVPAASVDNVYAVVTG